MSERSEVEIERIMRERARELARTLSHGDELTPRDEALVVRVGQARYAVPLRGVTGVVGLDVITPLPGAPSFVAGLAHVFGHVMTIVDLGVLLGEAPEPPSAAMLVEVRSGAFGLGISAYDKVLSVATDSLGAAPPGLSDGAARYVEGVVGATGVGLLRLTAIVNDLLRVEAGDEDL